jgi:hypothetical protein
MVASKLSKFSRVIMSTDPRTAAITKVQELIGIVQQQPPGESRDALVAECESLSRAIQAFHMEGIRFRAYNVDRLVHKGGLTLPPAAAETFKQIRQHLEEAGFHTRSHQSPV